MKEAKTVMQDTTIRTYPDTIEFEVSSAIIAAASSNHAIDGPLALALTDRLENRYFVYSGGYGRILAQPWDDNDAAIAPSEDAPWYELGKQAYDFNVAFDAGSRETPANWFTAVRIPAR